MQDEINERLDRIAFAIAQGSKSSANVLNTLHACRPGHPWNKDAVEPFTNLWFLLEARHVMGLEWADREWIKRKSRAEQRKSA